MEDFVGIGSTEHYFNSLVGDIDGDLLEERFDVLGGGDLRCSLI